MQMYLIVLGTIATMGLAIWPAIPFIVLKETNNLLRKLGETGTLSHADDDLADKLLAIRSEFPKYLKRAGSLYDPFPNSESSPFRDR